MVFLLALEERSASNIQKCPLFESRNFTERLHQVDRFGLYPGFSAPASKRAQSRSAGGTAADMHMEQRMTGPAGPTLLPTRNAADDRLQYDLPAALAVACAAPIPPSIPLLCGWSAMVVCVGEPFQEWPHSASCGGQAADPLETLVIQHAWELRATNRRPAPRSDLSIGQGMAAVP